jgi:hypothetical protein
MDLDNLPPPPANLEPVIPISQHNAVVQQAQQAVQQTRNEAQQVLAELHRKRQEVDILAHRYQQLKQRDNEVFEVANRWMQGVENYVGALETQVHINENLKKYDTATLQMVDTKKAEIMYMDYTEKLKKVIVIFNT